MLIFRKTAEDGGKCGLLMALQYLVGGNRMIVDTTDTDQTVIFLYEIHGAAGLLAASAQKPGRGICLEGGVIGHRGILPLS